MAEEYLIFSGGLTVLYFMAATFFIIHASLSYYNKQDNDNEHIGHRSRQTDSKSVILCILALLSMSICMALCILISFGSFIFIEKQQELYIIFFTARVMFHFGTTFVDLLFLNFVHVTFRKSSYDYPLWIKRALLIFILIIQIVFIIYNYLIFFVDYNYEKYRSLIYLPTQYIINISLLILFNRNLILIAKQSFLYSDDQFIKQNIKTQKLLNVVVRNSVLFSLIAIVALTEITTCLLNSPLVHININSQDLNKIYWIIQLCYCFSIAICVYLKMGFTTNTYYKMCKYPHLCCLKYVETTAAKLWNKSELSTKLSQPLLND